MKTLLLGALFLTACAAPLAELSNNGLVYPGNGVELPSRSDDSVQFVNSRWKIADWICPATGACWRQGGDDGAELRLEHTGTGATISVAMTPLDASQQNIAIDALLSQLSGTLISAPGVVRVTDVRVQRETVPCWALAQLDIASPKPDEVDVLVRSAIVRALIVKVPEIFFRTADGVRTGPVPARLSIVLRAAPQDFTAMNADFEALIGSLRLRGRPLNYHEGRPAGAAR